MSYKTRIVSISLGAALLMGSLMHRFESTLLKPFSEPTLDFDGSGLSRSVGQGLSLAVLGGYRSAVANLVWLDMNASWERRDFDATLARITLASTIDPRPAIFWLNGSRIIANDMPAWGSLKEDQLNPLFEGNQDAIDRRFAERALAFLEKGRKHKPNNADIVVEQAVICWRKLDDLPRSASLFLEASSLPHAPYYASRIYAEILQMLGKDEEALQFLEAHYSRLPDDELEAMKPIVAERIAGLRESLGK